MSRLVTVSRLNSCKRVIILTRQLNVNDFAVGLEIAHLLAVFQHLDPGAVGAALGGIEQRDIRDVNRRLSLDEAAGRAAIGITLGVALDHVDVLHHHAIVVTQDNTVPRLPLSLPVITMTSSPFLILRIARPPWLLLHRSQHFGRERHDLHELFGSELAGLGPEVAGTDRLELVIEQHRRIAVEADQRAIGAAHALTGTHDDGVVDLALFYLAARNGFLDADLDHITDTCIAALRSTQHFNAHQATGAAIVGRVQY